MRFKYKQILRNVIRPIIPVTLKYKGKTISYEALIDSGADTCVFPAEIGELVGIDIKTGKVYRYWSRYESKLNLHHITTEFFYKICVVGDVEDAAIIIGKRVFEFFYGWQIQMVGRFIKDQ